MPEWTDDDKREITLPGGRKRKIDPGIPPARSPAVGITPSDFKEIQDKMAKAGTGQDKDVLLKSLGLSASDSGDFNPATMETRFRSFNWKNEVEQSILQDRLVIPPEVQQQIDAILNDPALQTLEDVMSELDNLDPLAIPDEWWQKVGDYIGNLKAH